MRIIDKKTPKHTKLHYYKCTFCKEDFASYKKKEFRPFCSRKCFADIQRTEKLTGEIRKCKKCGKDFYSKKSEDRRGVIRSYCNKQCSRKDPSVPAGRHISYDGYWLITYKGKKTYREHRAIYEEHFGKIPKGYVVHHKNHNKLDNRIENLECMSRADHNKEHGFLKRK